MAVLLLRLQGPMQSWGASSSFNIRKTNRLPTKSGLLGLLAAAMGIARGNWTDLEPLTQLGIGVRVDRPGVPMVDFQTVGCSKEHRMMQADGKLAEDGMVTWRHYIADGSFLVGLEGEAGLLRKIQAALWNPRWFLSLGRRGCIPSEPIMLPSDTVNPVEGHDLEEVLSRWPWLGTLRRGEAAPEHLELSVECPYGEGVEVRDQVMVPFVRRQFATRCIKSKWIEFPA